MQKLHGLAVSGGIALAPAYVFRPLDIDSILAQSKACDDRRETLDELEAALLKSRAELEGLMRRFKQSQPEKAKILFAHRAILDDVAINADIREKILAEGIAAALAVNEVYDLYCSIIAASGDEFTNERTADLNDVRLRILRNLAGLEEQSLAGLGNDVVVVAHEVYPSVTANLDREHVSAIVTETGGMTSHTAIIAKSNGIPAVLGVEDLLKHVEDGVQLIVDARSGDVIIDPDEETLTMYSERQKQWLDRGARAEKYRNGAAITTDGAAVKVKLNISSAQSVTEQDAMASDGAGLFRTELLYMESGHLPGEEEQYTAYREVLSRFGEKPVTLRTLDIGGDKSLPGMELSMEMNPFLGLRALRLCFSRPELFQTQLRAALRASVHGRLEIMFPMVGSLDDFRRAKEMALEVKRGLLRENIPFCGDVKYGVMIEIPSIALMADRVAAEVDFASLGTNDLCQYLMAADRMNPAVSEYYREFDPSMFRLIGYAAQQFTAAGKSLGVCGEMASEPLAVMALLGLGIRSFSMSASAVAGVKELIASISISQAEEISGRVCRMDSADEVHSCLGRKYEELIT